MGREQITYLIASHNRAPFLADCLESLERQTSPHWRAILIDDGSTDDSLERARSLAGERVRVLANEQNLGYIRTLRRLIDEATTDIVAILDADDAIAPEATAALLGAYAADPAAAFVYSRFASCDASLGTRLAVHGGPIPQTGTAIRDGPAGAIRSFRRSLYRRTPGLDDTMLYAEDHDLIYKLEEQARPIFVDAVLYLYRRHVDSQSGDPAKREIGARNVRRGRRAALSRRRVRGAARVLAELFIVTDYLAYSARPPEPVRRCAAVAARAAAAAWRLHDSLRTGAPSPL